MLRALIVDDEPLARALIKKYCNDSMIVEVAGEAGNGNDALQRIEELKPDLVYLDIQIPGISGIALPDLLDEPPMIIFATAYDEYAVKAFEKNALDYLLKPIEYDRFLAATQKAAEKLASQKLLEEYRKGLANLNAGPGDYASTIAVKHKGDIIILKTSDITHFEATDDYLTIHLKGKKYLKKGTLKALEGKLDPSVFVRVHRSFIVNISSIQKIDLQNDQLNMLLSDNTMIPVSRTGLVKLKSLKIV